MRRFAFSFLFLSILQTAHAATDLPIPLANDAAARIIVSSCFSNLPFFGYAPISISITNDSGRAETWSFQFQSPAFFYVRTNSTTFAVDLAVQSKSTRTFKMLVPLAFRDPDYYLSPLGVTVSGPWSSGASMQQFSTVKRSGKSLSAFVAMSESLASRCWSQIEKELSKEDFAGTRFEPNELPDEWRAFVGIAAFWITNNELRLLSSGQRGALHDWVCRGGSLFVCGAADVDPQFRWTGFGTVSTLPNEEVNINETVTAIRELEMTSIGHQLTQSYGSEWKAATDIGPIKFNAPLLIGFMALFAIIAGPINLFVFAGRTRRDRLFWTTPLVSIVASGLLLLLIILQDGFGGSGSRVALVYISPTQKRDVLLQEQISRTGVLLSSSFQTRDPCFIAPIVLGTPVGSSPRRKYENSETNFAGQWFVSRSLQPHWIESVAPSRAGVALVNATEVRNAKVAPIIASNIGVVLEQIYFRDENGHAWSGHNVHAGQRVTLEAAAEIPDLLSAEAGPRLRTMWQRVNENKNCFYAITRDSASLIATVPSIRWKNDRVIYVGSLSNVTP